MALVVLTVVIVLGPAVEIGMSNLCRQGKNYNYLHEGLHLPGSYLSFKEGHSLLQLSNHTVSLLDHQL